MTKLEKTILVMLAMAQFILTLDSTVMNVSISTLVVDLNTTVAGIQAAITFYTLVMAAFMIPGAKVGDLIGRKRAFVLGTAIYATGSLVTSLSPSLPWLLFGWSFLEGIGAALMIPAMLSLIASNYPSGPKRVKAFATVAAIGAIGAAVGPIVGGVLTTYATWRLAFLGEVLVGIYILARSGIIKDSVVKLASRGFDFLGTLLSASSFSLLVLGILQASKYGMFRARKAVYYQGTEIIPAGGLSPTIILIAIAVILFILFALWQRHQKQLGRAKLVDLAILRNKVVRSGIGTIFFQMMLLGGVMYGISLYLQMELGYNAMQTGLTLMPLSGMILVLASRGDKLAAKYSTRQIVRVGFGAMLLGSAVLGIQAGHTPTGVTLIPSLALLGAGMGMVASQLQNVVQNSVDEAASAEASGLMATFQYLGQSFGTAISGALIIGVFIAAGSHAIDASTTLNAAQKSQLTTIVETQPQIVSDTYVESNLEEVPDEVADEVVALNAETRKTALSDMFILLAALSLLGLICTKNLPSKLS